MMAHISRTTRGPGPGATAQGAAYQRSCSRRVYLGADRSSRDRCHDNDDEDASEDEHVSRTAVWFVHAARSPPWASLVGAGLVTLRRCCGGAMSHSRRRATS
ncbi:hypothetical protein ACQY0O_004867 [Thecaphora frezii]